MVLIPRALGAAMLALALLASGCAPAPATPTQVAAAPTAASAPATAPAAPKPTTPPATIATPTTGASAAQASTAAPTAVAKPAAAATTAAAQAGPAATPTTAAQTGAAAKPTAAGAAAVQPDFSLDVKYGVLVGLTGDAATGGQAWNQAVRVAVDSINQQLQKAGYAERLKATLVDSQDSEGNPQRGVEAAQKLVSIDHVTVVVGDLFSSVTSAVAPSVIVPNQVLEFTGGTNPSLTKLNPAGGPTLIWQPVAADDIQGKVLAKLMGDTFGKTATVNVGIRNDAYGTGLSDVFKTAWTAQGGKVGKEVTYNPTQPTFDTEAQQLVDGSPDAWLFTDFCQTFAKLVGPLQRTGKWDGARTWGGDALTNCGISVPEAAVPGMRSVQANASAGSSFKDYQDLFQSNAQTG